MKKLILILCVFSMTVMASGCAEQSVTPEKKSGNTADEQRAHAEKAQGELSSEVKK